MFSEPGQATPTCIPARHLPVFENERGRPCPHVVLQPANREAAELARIALSEHRRMLAPLYFEAIAESLSSDEQRALVERVSRALDSKTVLDKLYPKPQGKEG